MRSIAIEFGAKPLWLQPGAKLFALGGILLIFSLAPLVWLHSRTTHIAAELQRFSSAQSVNLPVASPRVVDESTSNRLGAATQELTIPWERLFGAIEGARTESITLLSIEPDARNRVLRLTAQASSYTEALGFIERLGHRQPLTEVILDSHEAQPPANSDGPVHVVLQARWSGS